MASTGNIELQLRGIELLTGAVFVPDEALPLVNFSFSIDVESKVDAEERLVFVIVTVTVLSEDERVRYGSIAVSNIYHIANFREFITLNGEDNFELPKELSDLLRHMSISTTRGVMFSTFKGTFLHNALLPIFDQGF